jgi:GNAT superfamily N-acetyltransferase
MNGVLRLLKSAVTEPPKSPVEIRLASAEDARAIAEAHVLSWRATYPGIVPQQYIDSLKVEEFADRWRTRIVAQSEMVIYVADCTRVICGFASGGPARAEIADFSGELYAIYLSPGAHSKGIGARLFWTVKEHLHCAGLRSMYVRVIEENPSRGFYEHMGGGRLSSEEIEIGGKPLTEVLCGWPDIASAMNRGRSLA